MPKDPGPVRVRPGREDHYAQSPRLRADDPPMRPLRRLRSLLPHPGHPSGLVPRVTLAWAALAALLLVWYPHRGPLVHFASTSLANLDSHPLWAIGLSVFVLAGGWGEWATWMALSVVWVLVEAGVGWRRALVVFLAGHVLATLGVALAQAVLVQFVHGNAALARVHDDVGASYGFLALAGLGLASAVSRDRRWWAATPALVLAVVLQVGPWTILGHALAVAVGVTAALVLPAGEVALARSAPLPVPVKA